MSGPPDDRGRPPAPGEAFTVVIPSIGRPSLTTLIGALDAASGPLPEAVVVVDDRRQPGPLPLPPTRLALQVVASGGRGPAAARNLGWRAAGTPWVTFLDDDVVPSPSWLEDLAEDLRGLPAEVAGSQGRIEVPRAVGRRPTDWERATIGLEEARWITADLAYRRDVLAEVGGFDERFPRAFREDADLGLRIHAAGYLVVRGERVTRHPVRPAGPWASVRAQAGNADDVLMFALHGPGWRHRAGAEARRTGRHLATTAALLAAVVSRRRSRRLLALAAWAAGTAELAAARIRPGPRTAQEVLTMVGTSAVLPPAATAHWMRGWVRLRSLLHDTGRAPLGVPRPPLRLAPARLWTPRAQRAHHPPVDLDWAPGAVLFDRDGTLVVDVPYNADPGKVALMPGARLAVARARQAGLKVGVVTNQSGVGAGRIAPDQLEGVHRQVEALLGPLDTWAVCPHRPQDGCGCRKPAPGLVQAAADALGVDPRRCVVVGDTAGDVEAARAAGARSVLVPNRATQPEEIGRAPTVAPDVLCAVDLIVAGTC